MSNTSECIMPIPQRMRVLTNVLCRKIQSFCATLKFHYENMSMQYTAIFHGCKNVNFQMKNSNIFLTFAQNIDCGYTLEPPH